MQGHYILYKWDALFVCLLRECPLSVCWLGLSSKGLSKENILSIFREIMAKTRCNKFILYAMMPFPPVHNHIPLLKTLSSHYNVDFTWQHCNGMGIGRRVI